MRVWTLVCGGLAFAGFLVLLVLSGISPAGAELGAWPAILFAAFIGILWLAGSVIYLAARVYERLRARHPSTEARGPSA